MQRINQVIYVSATPGEYERDPFFSDSGTGDPPHRPAGPRSGRSGRWKGRSTI